jgi:type II secretory pathway pseudopilin PulG
MRTRTRAFSLVEVLISIVVLALGLLGLAAVFPAVVSQQRQATDSVLGASAQNSVTTYLKGSFALNKASYPNSPAGGIIPDSNQRGWMLLAGNTAWSPPLAFPGYLDGDFVMPTGNSGDPIAIDPATGKLTITGLGGPGAWNPGGTTSIDLPAAERLNPAPFTAGSQPLYVWDVAARRVAAGVTPNAANDRLGLQDDSVQLAIFIRRIDTGIRKPIGRSLSDVLGGNVPAADQRVPVAEDATSLRPTFDGMGGGTAPNYSNIHAISFDFHNYDVTNPDTTKQRFDRLRLDTSGNFPQLVPYVQQIGQKFVDSWGVVHTVSSLVRKRDLDTADPEHDAQSDQIVAVLVTPPADYATFQYLTSNATTTPRLYFTTQIPAAVFTVTIATPEPGSN